MYLLQVNITARNTLSIMLRYGRRKVEYIQQMLWVDVTGLEGIDASRK